MATNRGQSAMSLFLAILILSPALVLSWTGECPNFKCTLPYANKANGDWYDGKFVERDAPWDEAKDADDGVVAYYYFDPNDFPDAYPDISQDGLSNAQLACATVCERYNTEGGSPRAGYWMFEQTCDWGIGGQCMCMDNETTCSGPYWSDEWQEPEEWGQYFKNAATYSTGKLCGSGAQGDPHFTGADGSHFDFSGVPNKGYALVSDSHLQVNAFFGGRYAKWDDRVKSLNWMRKITIMWGHHVVLLAARPGRDADYKLGYLDSILVDGEPLQLTPHAKTSALGGEFTVLWDGVKVRNGRDWVDQLLVEVKGLLSMRLTIRPEVKNLRTQSDAIIHFTVKMESVQISNNAHGILGQTYRPDFSGRLAQQKLEYSELLNTLVVPGDNAEGFIDGTPADYEVKDLEKADCQVCRFARGTSVDEETTKAIAMNAVVTSMASARKLMAAFTR